MQTVYSDPKDDNGDNPRKISHVFAALEAAMEVQKRKVIVGPNDSVGIVMFNTVCLIFLFDVRIFHFSFLKTRAAAEGCRSWPGVSHEHLRRTELPKRHRAGRSGPGWPKSDAYYRTLDVRTE